MDAVNTLADVHISVSSRYLTVPTQYLAMTSQANQSQHLFHYDICVKNRTDGPIHLFSRHWVALDAHGQEQNLADQGMLVKQVPILSQEDYVYQGICKLATHEGVLTGLVGLQLPCGYVHWLPVPKHDLRRPVRLVVNEPAALQS